MRKDSLQTISFAVLCWFAMNAAMLADADPSKCQRECGNVAVPYPFGLGDSDDCYKDSTYKLICNESFNPPRLYHQGAMFPFINISFEKSTAHVVFPISFACYNRLGLSSSRNVERSMDHSPFYISTLNKFFAIGCDTFSGLLYLGGKGTGTGCFSVCNSNKPQGQAYTHNFTEELKSCRGTGCCQSAVPKGMNKLLMFLTSAFNHRGQLDTNPCSFAFLADPTWYKDVANFTLKDTPRVQKYSHVVLDWFIRGNTCEEAKQSRKPDDYICGENTTCSNSETGPGYICSCKKGFRGNPYTKAGCEAV